jgi:osmotically-inducible protein OsmY
MNQREDTQGQEHVERGREANGGRDHHPGGHGFDETQDHSYSQSAAGRDAERWNNGFERQHHDQQHRGSWDSGRDSGRGREWPSIRDAGGGPSGGWEGGRRGGWDTGRSGYRGAGWDAGRGYGGGDAHGSRAYGANRPVSQDQYGSGQRAHWHEPLFGRQQPFGPPEDTHYYGTGSAGYGGPGFTGGAYAYGNGPRDEGRQIEDEYSDESAVSYEQGPRQQYGQRPYGQRHGPQSGQHFGQPYDQQYGRHFGQQYGQGQSYAGGRRFTSGPKGYQRSDERLKEDISERLMELHHIDSSDVSIDVRGAKVVLDGTVPSRHMKHAIEDLVDACPGVQDIDNRVRVANQSMRQSQGTQSQGTHNQSPTGSSAGTGIGAGSNLGSGATGSAVTTPNGVNTTKRQ